MSNKTDLQEIISKLVPSDSENPTFFGDKFTEELTRKLNLALQNNYGSSFNVGSVNFVIDRLENLFTLNVQVLNSNFSFSPRVSTGTTLDTDTLIDNVNSYLNGVFSGIAIPITPDKLLILSEYVDSLPNE